MKRSLTIICAVLFAGFLDTVTAQDIHFSQFNEIPQLVNPALTASTHDMRASLNYKDQWSSVAVPYKTYGASFEAKLDFLGWDKIKGRSGFFTRSTKNAGVGVFFFRDRAGDADMGTTRGGISLSSTIPMDKLNSISMGLSGAFSQFTIKYANLTWGNQFNGVNYDPNLSTGETFANDQFFYFDASGGVHWNYGKGERYMRSNDKFKANAGIGVFHLNRPKYSVLGDDSERLAMKYVLSGGFIKGIKLTNLDIAPSFIYTFQRPAREFIIGSMFKYNFKDNSVYTGLIQQSAFSVGAHYRNRDALIVTTLFELGKYALGFSYDVNTSRLRASSSYKGGFEVSLRFSNPNPFLYQNRSRI